MIVATFGDYGFDLLPQLSSTGLNLFDDVFAKIVIPLYSKVKRRRPQAQVANKQSPTLLTDDVVTHWLVVAPCNKRQQILQRRRLFSTVFYYLLHLRH